MRSALQPHMDLRGDLNFINQLVRADLDRLQTQRKIGRYALSEALYGEVAKTISIIGFSNVIRILDELTNDFQKRGEVQVTIPGSSRKRTSSAPANENFGKISSYAEMRIKVYKLYTIGLRITRLVTLQITSAILIKTLFATNNKRKGCEGPHKVRPLSLHCVQAWGAANAEPVAARSQRPAKPAEWDSQKTRTEQHPADEPGRRVVAAIFTGREARATWVLRSDYDANGNQRRGGWTWDPKDGGAATISAAAGLVFSIYGSYGAEYINKQTFGEQHSNYDKLGVGTGLGSTIGAYAGAIAAAYAKQSANAEFDAENGISNVNNQGDFNMPGDASKAANQLAQTHQAAGIFQGSGYALSLGRLGNSISSQIQGIGMGAFDGNGFTSIGAAAGGVANWFAGVATGSAWSLAGGGSGIMDALGGAARFFGWESGANYAQGKGYRDDAEVAEVRNAYLTMMSEADGVDVFKDLASNMAKSGLFTEDEIKTALLGNVMQRQAEHNAAYKDALWNEALGKADQYLVKMAGFGYDTGYAEALRTYATDHASRQRILQEARQGEGGETGEMYRFMRQTVIQDRIAELEGKYGSRRNASIAARNEAQIRRDVDKEFGQGAYDQSQAENEIARIARDINGGGVIAGIQYKAAELLAERAEMLSFGASTFAQLSGFAGLQPVAGMGRDAVVDQAAQVMGQIQAQNAAMKAMLPPEMQASYDEFFRQRVIEGEIYIATAETIALEVATFGAGKLFTSVRFGARIAASSRRLATGFESSVSRLRAGMTRARASVRILSRDLGGSGNFSLSDVAAKFAGSRHTEATAQIMKGLQSRQIRASARVLDGRSGGEFLGNGRFVVNSGRHVDDGVSGFVHEGWHGVDEANGILDIQRYEVDPVYRLEMEFRARVVQRDYILKNIDQLPGMTANRRLANKVFSADGFLQKTIVDYNIPEALLSESTRAAILNRTVESLPVDFSKIFRML